MAADRCTAERLLRVIHACEKGATGVYWGHRLVAAVLHRDVVPQLTLMHAHELEHYSLFGEIMKRRNVRTVVAPAFWCAGGIIYGVVTGLGGRRAIWKSTAVIEAIVERELREAATHFEHSDPEVHAAIHRILLDEMQHKLAGELQSPGDGPLDAAVGTAARAGAAASKRLAEKL
ncbi:demethoxyubiquinone hydroxylase family protein [Aquabacterium sp.]|uniref:demethoxyubiquinone hydroxylase family protein n=1 Tax=Aquabacterium sp. TaxID=1872578 RepID=UPI003782D796